MALNILMFIVMLLGGRYRDFQMYLGKEHIFEDC